MYHQSANLRLKNLVERKGPQAFRSTCKSSPNEVAGFQHLGCDASVFLGILLHILRVIGRPKAGAKAKGMASVPLALQETAT